MASSISRKLNLNDLREGLPAITPDYGAGLAEAGAVCLEDQGHSHGVTLSVNGSFNEAFETYWTTVTDHGLLLLTKCVVVGTISNLLLNRVLTE